MKKILTLVLLLFLTSTGFTWPFIKPRPKPTPVPTVVVEPKPTFNGGRELLGQIKKELLDAKEENRKLKVYLDSAKQEIITAKTKTDEVQKAADSLKEWGNIQQAEAQKFMEKYNSAVVRYHRLKLIAALIAAAGGVLLGLQFMNFAPPPYNLLVPVGGAGLFGSLIWIFF